MKPKKTTANEAGHSTLATLIAIVVIGVLGYCLYDEDTREKVKDVLDGNSEESQSRGNNSSDGQPADQDDGAASTSEPVDTRGNTAQPGAGNLQPLDPAIEAAFNNSIQWVEQALRDLDAKEKRLLPRQFKLNHLNNKFERKRTWAKSEEESWTGLLAELKEAYRQGESSEFPVNFHDYDVDQQTLEHKIVQARQLVVEQGKLCATYGQQARRAKALSSKVDKVLTEIAHTQRVFGIKVEVARIKKEFEGLDTVREDLGEILDTAEALVQQSDHLDLFELRENSHPSGFTRKQFEQIMNRN